MRPRSAVAALVWFGLLATMLATSVRGDEAASTPRDSWFVMSLGGVDCGWLHEQVEVAADRVVTSNDMLLTLGRAGTSTTVRVAWKFAERDDGTPVQCEVEQTSGDERSRTVYRFAEDAVTIEESAGGRAISRTIPFPADPRGPWWSPGKVERYLLECHRAGTSPIKYLSVDPSAGMKIVEFVSKRVGDGSKGTALWVTTNDSMGLATEDEVDSTGAVLVSKTKLPIGELVARRGSEQDAKRGSRGAGIDVIDRSMVVLSKPAGQLLTAGRARFAVRSKDGSVVSLPTSGAQRSEPLVGGDAIIDVEVGRGSTVTAEESGDNRYLASTILIDGSDPAVKALAARALKAAGLSATSPVAARAEALRSFVHRFIVHKDLATAFAGASAVAQSKSGDCSEHAMLLAALLRADQIPSRVASGLVYAESFGGRREVFAWHMWTQAQVDQSWIDLDATLSRRSYHPGHLLIATSAQDDPQLDSDFSSLLETVGNITIEVVNVQGPSGGSDVH